MGGVGGGGDYQSRAFMTAGEGLGCSERWHNIVPYIAYRLFRMNAMIEARAVSALDALKCAGLEDNATVILVGSFARGVTNQRSDIDILVLNSDGRRIRLKRPGDLHLQQDSRTRFLKRLEAGDDYPAWALRFGMPIRDPDGWWAQQAASETIAPHWPDWRPKVEHARKRTRMTSELLEVEDTDAASEELLFAASHIARATLLRNGVFPFSRPELPSQLKAVDSGLARLLERLMDDAVDSVSLRASEALVKQRMEQLSDLRP